MPPGITDDQVSRQPLRSFVPAIRDGLQVGRLVIAAIFGFGRVGAERQQPVQVRGAQRELHDVAAGRVPAHDVAGIEDAPGAAPLRSSPAPLVACFPEQP